MSASHQPRVLRAESRRLQRRTGGELCPLSRLSRLPFPLDRAVRSRLFRHIPCTRVGTAAGELWITKSRLCADAPAACAQLSGLLRDAGRAPWSARPFEPRPCVLMLIVGARRSWPDVKAPYWTPHLGSHASMHG
jgi:hypothetical protein